MVFKSIFVFCVLDVESGNIFVFEGVFESVFFGQVSVDLDYIIFGVWGFCLSYCFCLYLFCGFVYRYFGFLEIQVWCSQVGGMSFFGWVFVFVLIVGEEVEQGRGFCSLGQF